MATATLSRRVRRVVAYPPLCDMSDLQRREFHEALLDADTFEDLPGSGRPRSSRQSRTGRTCGSSTAARSEEFLIPRADKARRSLAWKGGATQEAPIFGQARSLRSARPGGEARHQAFTEPRRCRRGAREARRGAHEPANTTGSSRSPPRSGTSCAVAWSTSPSEPRLPTLERRARTTSGSR
jgi:hypothetical protein